MTIWFDVTATLAWTRPAVGIIRVESECARSIATSAPEDVRFCSFDAPAGRYREVSSSTLDAHFHAIAAAPRAEASATLSEAPATSRLPRWARRVRAYARRLLGRARTARAEDPSPVTPSAPFVFEDPIFARGDVYVTMGLDFLDKDLVGLAELKRRVGFSVVMTAYDTIPVRLPHLAWSAVAERFDAYLGQMADCADSVLCISECTRRDLRAHLEERGLRVPELETFVLGTEIRSNASREPRPEVLDILGTPFLLYVSTIERRKNHETVYRAYVELVERGRRDLPLLVFVGMKGWGVDDLYSDLELDPRTLRYVRILDRVSDGELALLYEKCTFTVFPSLYEGWGLPVAESLACGRFCLASNAGAIPEVAGDLIDYLDPWDVPGWADRIGYLVDHPDEVAAREARIRQEYTPHRWSDTSVTVLRHARRSSR